LNADYLIGSYGWLTRLLTEQERAILNIKACVEAAGSSLDKVMTRRIYMIEMKDFRKVVAVWDR